MASSIKKGRWLVLLLVALLVGAYLAFDLGQYFTLDAFTQKKEAIDSYYAQHPLLMSAGYFLLYVAVFALALPIAAVLSLAGGAVFGLLWGVVLISFASSIGSLMAFLASRYVMRDAVQQRFADSLKGINELNKIVKQKKLIILL